MCKRNTTNIYKNIIIGILTAITIILFCVVVYIFLFCSSGIWQEYVTVSPSEYGNWSGHIDYEREEIESGLYIFPEDISETLDVDYFYYSALDYHSISNILIFTEVTYSEEEYEIEKERLAGLECEIALSEKEQPVSNSIVYSEDLFSYPAYVTIYGSNLSYEYALVDEQNNKIIYVYAKMKDLNEMIPDKYLPIEAIDKNMYESNSWDNINIYFAEDQNGDYRFYDNNKVVINFN